MTSGLDEQTLAYCRERSQEVVQAVGRVFVGPSTIAERMLTCLLAGGHVLLEGVPGVAKTTLVKAFAGALGCAFKRVQFTPDMLPSDITGTYVLSPQTGTFTLREGPIFANVILGDEINRAPAKTQSALLEAMQEKQVTIEGETRPLPSPFIVLATQNPIEQAGTYPLPEAQVDRFLMKLRVDYPSFEDEKGIVRRFAAPPQPTRAVLDQATVMALRERSQQVHIEESVVDFIVRLVAATRSHRDSVLGASPRASLALANAARAHALLHGRGYVLPDDVKALAQPVLAHRIVMTPEAEIDARSGSDVVRDTLASTAPRST